MTSTPSDTSAGTSTEPAAQARIAICDFPAFPHMKLVTDSLAEALAAAGYRSTRFESPGAMNADPEALRQFDVIVGFGGMQVGANVITDAPRLRGVVSLVSGTEGIDVAAATQSGVIVGHAPTPENVRGMAEAAVMLMLNLMFDLDGTRENMRISGTRPLTLNARMIKGKTIGLVGYGRISATVAMLLSTWGVKLQVYSRRDAIEGLAPEVRIVDIETLMSTSDIVCVLAGLDPTMKGFINDARIRLMKKSAYLVNVARGSILDQQAVADALKEGRIAGAALDVFEVEPLPADSPLRDAPNTILTPHHVGHTQEVDESIHLAAQANVLALLEGRLPPMVKNPVVSAGWLGRWGGKVLGKAAG